MMVSIPLPADAPVSVNTFREMNDNVIVVHARHVVVATDGDDLGVGGSC